jgi:hypothetical protein
VRQTLDELEAAAPWDELYYPPQDDAAFLAMALALLDVIDRIPREVQALTASLEQEAQDEASRQLLGDAEFFFAGIHSGVTPDIARLRLKIASLEAAAGDGELTPEERDFACEIAADLKGKYASSMMGAAAGLIAEGRWDGVEIEPILFPEKAQEFERNERLVETLNEVVENITNLLAEVPLAEMAEHWRRQERIDLYALTPLYSFLGNLGKLMKEESRRALYSGDYHQIRKRERLLNVRINELTTLHNMTWATDSTPAMADGSSPYPLMIRKSTELAAILDVEILRQIIGDKYVKDLLFIVTVEKERAAAAGGDLENVEASSMRRSVPEDLHPLIRLLYGEDLLNFLSLLLGAVLKRASLALGRQRGAPPAVAAAAPAPAAAAARLEVPAPEEEEALPEIDDVLPEIDDALFADLDLEFAPPSLPVSAPPAPAPRLAEQRAALGQLSELLEKLLSRSDAHRKSFELVLRLLKQGRKVPPAMLQSMHPYLFDIMNTLIPQLHDLDHLSEISATHAARLFEYCTFLCDRHLTPDQIRREVPKTMERVLRLLDGLHGTASKLVEDLVEE